MQSTTRNVIRPLFRSQIRSFAKKSTPPSSTKATTTTSKPETPPIKLPGLHGRYANATFISASKHGHLSKVESELEAIKNVSASNPAFSSFLLDPTVGPAKKDEIIRSILGSNVTSTTTNLMSALAGNARLGETGKVAEAFGELMKARRGEVAAVVTTAKKLDKGSLSSIAKALEKKVGAGKKVDLTAVVDESIMGGVVVQIGDEMVDLTVKARIEEVGRVIGA